jgi:hypothetical protein
MFDDKLYAWTGGMANDHVSRLNVKTGEVVDYLLPSETNIRRVDVDKTTPLSQLWSATTTRLNSCASSPSTRSLCRRQNPNFPSPTREGLGWGDSLEKRISFVVFLAASLVTASTQASAAPVPEFGPNPAVGWLVISNGFLPPDSGAGPIRQDPAHPYVGNDEFRRTGRQPTMPFADLSNPIPSAPDAQSTAKTQRARARGQSTDARDRLRPAGGAAFLIRSNVQPYFFVQAPDKVVILLQDDAQFRQIYLTGAHSKNLKPSWSGESIGHYEGDELVVDTIGIAGKAPIDKFFTPHTDQLHLIERFRLTSGGDRLEVSVRFEDPGAFTVPWNGKIVYQRVEPGRAERVFPPGANSGATEAGPILEKRCAENPFFLFRKRRPTRSARRFARFLIEHIPLEFARGIKQRESKA